MKKEKPKLIALDIVCSSRLRIELEAEFRKMSEKSPLTALVKLLHLCDNYIGGNEVHSHPTIRKNVKLVKGIRGKTLKLYNAKKPADG